MHLFVLGYPGPVGGANTECWHTVKLWRQHGVDVTLIPTWGECDPVFRKKLDAIGANTLHIQKDVDGGIIKVPDIAGSIVVGFCNANIMTVWPQLKEMGCKIVWLNSMTFMFWHEVECFCHHGLPDAFVFQSQFQRDQIEVELMKHPDYRKESAHIIRGAFDIDDWRFAPAPRKTSDDYVVGRLARGDADKWSSNMWAIYSRVLHPKRRVLVMGCNSETTQKIGPAPRWGEVLPANMIPAPHFHARLHCLFTFNGGACENWPRVGLEAMAAGVPIVTENQWGWREMIEHGVTGFLGDSDEEMAFYASCFAWDDDMRLKIARQARERLGDELANPKTLWAGWETVFNQLGS